MLFCMIASAQALACFLNRRSLTPPLLLSVRVSNSSHLDNVQRDD